MALAFLRRQQWWLKYFLALVVLSFIILYIPAFVGKDSGTPGETVAKVGGIPISIGEFQRAYMAQRQRLEQIYQGKVDPSMLKSLHLEDQVLDSLVSDRLVVLEARRQGLEVSDEEVAREISRMPGLQEGGRFVGAAEYRRRLDMQGRSVVEFEETVRSSLLRQKLEALVTDGVLVTSAEAEREFRRRTEQIKAEYVLLDADRFRAQTTLGDDEVRARFDSRKELYRISEKRTVSYVLLDTDALGNRVSVTDSEIDAYYQEHKDDFRQEEMVCASHILVKMKGEGAPEGHADAEAKRVAEALLAQVKSGGDFAALARKSSEDKGSAARGGDLACFPRGRMAQEFENAAFALREGETSELVKSSFGYHIIRVASHQDESQLPLEKVKERIRRTLVAEHVQSLAEQKAQAVAAELARGKGLEAAAKEQGLSVQRSPAFARNEDAGGLFSPALVARAFELKPGEVDREGFPAPKGYAFIQLAEVQPSRAPELKEVQERVKADLTLERVLERARATAGELKARAEKDGLDKAATAMGLVRKETSGLVGRGQALGDLAAGVALEEVAYALPEKTLSDPVRAGTGYAVLRVLEKKPFDNAAFEKQRGSLVASLKEEKKGRLFQAYMGQARQRFSVEKRPEAFRRVASR